MIQPTDTILKHWQLADARSLTDKRPQWKVTRRRETLVLRHIPDDYPDIDYELSVLAALDDTGWSVPILLDQHTEDGQHWLLFNWLPGEPLTTENASDVQRRGHRLAELHSAMSAIAIPGQRAGFTRVDAIVSDPRLDTLLPAIAEQEPEASQILQWHREQAQGAFLEHDVESLTQHPIHSDFARWNLLFDNGRYSGLLDLEATHHNFRIADFALSWRGSYDNVLTGYEEVTPLSELEQHLLAPTFWAWLMMGVADAIEQHLSDHTPLNLAWQVKQMQRRSPRFGRWQMQMPV
ncbi:MAG: phosphotransferase [Pseudomonadota bacterium]